MSQRKNASEAFSSDDRKRRRKASSIGGVVLLMVLGLSGIAGMGVYATNGNSSNPQSNFTGTLASNPQVAIDNVPKFMDESGGIGFDALLGIGITGISLGNGNGPLATFNELGTSNFLSHESSGTVTAKSTSSSTSSFNILEKGSQLFVQIDNSKLPSMYSSMRWTNINPQSFAAAGGINSSGFSSIYILLGEIDQLVSTFSSLGNVEETKTGLLNGVAVSQYSASMDVAKAEASLGPSSPLASILSATLENSLALDVFLDNSGRLRGFDIKLNIKSVNSQATTSSIASNIANIGIELDLSVEINSFNQPVSVTQPPDNEVLDFPTYYKYSSAPSTTTTLPKG